MNIKNISTKTGIRRGTIAKKIKRTEGTVRNRVRRLREKGIITAAAINIR